MIAAVLEPHVLNRLGERIPDVAEWLLFPSTVEGSRVHRRHIPA
jgi:hypothetical protein